jgi:SAM-dependent methyltransferase
MKDFYERYWDRESAELGDFAYKWPILSKFIPVKPCVILDYGCGKGKILFEVRKINSDATLYGADISAIARRAAKKSIPTARIVLIRDDQRTPVQSGSCDFVLSLDVIEHIYDTEQVFREFQRIVKPGGILLISTPYYGLIKNIAISLVGFDTIYNPVSAHIRFYTRKSLKKLLSLHGFSIKKFGYYGRFPFIWRGMYALCFKTG